jgi:hypothetical protein
MTHKKSQDLQIALVECSASDKAHAKGQHDLDSTDPSEDDDE